MYESSESSCVLSDQLQAWKDAGTYQRLRQLESACEPTCRFDGREVINLASNNYLALTNHPKLVEATIEAARRYGAGSGAVRTISGTMSCTFNSRSGSPISRTLRPVWFFNRDSRPMRARYPRSLTPEDHIISDELNHASIIDGCRLSKAKIHVFPHAIPRRRGEISPALKGSLGRQATDHRRRFLNGWRHRAVAGAGRSGRAVRRHHDDRRRAFVRRAWAQRSRYGRSFRSPWTREHPGGHAIESDRRSGRVCVRQP